MAPGGLGDGVDDRFRWWPEAVLHLHHQALGGLASDAGHLGQRSNVLVLNAHRKGLDIDSRQQRQRDFRTDPRYFDQAPKQSALIVRAEAVQDMRILANHEMSQKQDFLAHGRQQEERGHRRLDLVTDSTDLHQELRRCLGGNATPDRSDHRDAN